MKHPNTDPNGLFPGEVRLFLFLKEIKDDQERVRNCQLTVNLFCRRYAYKPKTVKIYFVGLLKKKMLIKSPGVGYYKIVQPQ